MASRLVPSSLRGRLVAVILLIAIVVLAGSFFALHEGTGADLNRAIDDNLRADAAEFQASGATGATSAAELRRQGRRFIAEQGYHADSRIFAIAVAGGGVLTNEPRAVSGESSEHAGESADGDDAAPGILGAPDGLAEIDAPDGGRLRVLSEPIGPPGAPVGSFHVAQSLSPVGEAQGSLRDTLLIVGIIALAVLIGSAVWIATLVARPLSRIASFAAGVDPTGLDRRLGEERGSSEVRSLAHSFNHMLDRLQRSFDREREFVADASHELRTPVTIAQGELDLLRRELAGTERERVDVVRRELRRMERLVSDMLLLASEEGERGLTREPVDVSDLLSDLRRDLPLMGVRSYEVAELGGTVEADPDRLAQVFRNLLRNAVSHTSEGARIGVVAEPDRDRGSVRFEIFDDGPGFGPDEADRLFDRFYRTDGGRTRDGGGSGLGLAIARSIVEAHGGSIRAIPSNGAGGGRVAFELPGYRA